MIYCCCNLKTSFWIRIQFFFESFLFLANGFINRRIILNDPALLSSSLYLNFNWNVTSCIDLSKLVVWMLSSYIHLTSCCLKLYARWRAKCVRFWCLQVSTSFHERSCCCGFGSEPSGWLIYRWGNPSSQLMLNQFESCQTNIQNALKVSSTINHFRKRTCIHLSFFCVPAK